MVNLDDVSVYRQFDKLGMLGHLHRFPEQCQKAWEKVQKFELPREYTEISNVLIVGMGGSAIGGDFVRRLALAESKLPVWVHRDYGLPVFVDANTLVIASSYSGNTEETLSAFTKALETQSKKLVIASGGKLKPRSLLLRMTRVERKGHSWSGRCVDKSTGTAVGWLGESFNPGCRQRHKTQAYN